MELNNLGKWLFVVGLAIAVFGGLLWLVGRLPFLGNLPGDIRLQSENFSVFIPLGTMLLFSVVLTIVVNVALRVVNR